MHKNLNLLRNHLLPQYKAQIDGVYNSVTIHTNK